MNNSKIDFKAVLAEVFDPIIGQARTKRELMEHLDCYRFTRKIPNLLIISPKGQGKTTFSEALAKGLYEFDDRGEIKTLESTKVKGKVMPVRKKLLVMNCASLPKTETAFVNSVVMPRIQNKDVTIFFDEASEISKDVSMALLTMLNPNPSNKNNYEHNGYIMEIDFTRQTFIFATSEPHKVFGPLADRLERISLDDYSLSELGQIVERGLGHDIVCEPDALHEVSTVLRGNARDGQKMGEKIRNFLRGAKRFTMADWNRFREVFSIRPLGLNALEARVLRFLGENMEGTSLTTLAAKSGMGRDALRLDTELYLQKFGLMEINSGGRQITTKGLDYLRELDALGIK